VIPPQDILGQSAPPFCDGFAVSIPPDALLDELSALRECLLQVIDGGGLSLEFADDDKQIYRCALPTAILRLSRSHRVFRVECSGAMLAHLRTLAIFPELLSALSALPLRVTALHAALDVAVAAPPFIFAITQRARFGDGIFLSRKMIPRGHVTTFLSLDSDGVETGSVYMGGPQAERRLVVYDKRHERLQKVGVDIGPTLRYEARFKSGTGASLRDVWNPLELFWDAVAPDVLPRPSGVAPWRSHAEGFHLDKPPEITAFQKMERLVDQSPDVARLLYFCTQMGRGGFDALVRALAKYHSAAGMPVQDGVAPSSPARASTPTDVGSGGVIGRPDSLH
jgi:hypothetical protein